MSLLSQIEEQTRRVKKLESALEEARLEVKILEEKLRIESTYLQDLVNEETRAGKDPMP